MREFFPCACLCLCAACRLNKHIPWIFSLPCANRKTRMALRCVGGQRKGKPLVCDTQALLLDKAWNAHARQSFVRNSACSERARR